MSEEYKDIDGNPISLERLVLREPEWAASRIRAGQREGVTKRFEYLGEQLAARDKRIADLDATILFLESENARIRQRKIEYVRIIDTERARIKELEAENKELRRKVALAKDAYQTSGGPDGERSLRVLWDALGMP